MEISILKLYCFFIFIFWSTALTANAQDTVWISKQGTIVSSSDSIMQYNVIYKNVTDSQMVRVVSFWADGTIISEANYFPYIPKPVLHGIFRRYSNGRLTEEQKFANGDLHGFHDTFWDNGIQKRNDLYENGKFISGNCYTSAGEDTAWYAYEQAASFNGGMDSLRRFIQRHLIYPPLAKAQGIQGVVKVQFTIAKDGSLDDINVINSVDSTLAKAAIHLIKQIPRWMPATVDGSPVKMRFILPVVFRLNE